MPTEDVVIRLRVDDTELRRRLGELRGRTAGVANVYVDSPDLVNLAAAGAAGSVFAGGRPIGPSVSASMREARLRKRVAEALGGTMPPHEQAEFQDRQVSTDFDRKSGYQYNSFRKVGLDPVPFTWQHNFDLDEQLRNMRPPKPGVMTPEQIRLERALFSMPGDTWDSRWREPARLTTGLGPPSLLQRGAARAKDFGTALVSGERGLFYGQSFYNRVRDLKLSDLGLKNLSFNAVKEAASRVGIVTSAVGAMAVASDMSKARSEYFQKLLLTDETPNPDYLNLGFKKTLGKIQDTWGKLTLNTMFEVPSVILEGLGSVFGANEAFGMAIDTVGMQWKETLGLTEQDYTRVAELQSAWNKGWQRMKEQVLEQAKRQANSVAARLANLGADGVPLADLEKTVYKVIKTPLLRKADAEFRDTNPFPTSRDVNPYGVDGEGFASHGVTVGAKLYNFFFD